MREMTKKSLNEAFAGESMACMKYTAFSEAAARDGLANVSRLFKAIAYAEQVHATNHAKSLGLVGATEENLKAAIEGENFEVDEMYPAYDAIAGLQGEEGAKRSIHYAVGAEKIHAGLYQEAAQAVSGGKDADMSEIYICPVCGFTRVGKPPERCPVCKVPSEKFKKF
ncbi:MAG: rubrerythrin [Thermoplasmata archaeon HGW-Thermoplasmata-1]|nr:MAG: rubrerythrin [Thermoplasmata archaeon HGW-Thermoplasmata-1]